jgi:hypothetical protein
VPLSDPASEAPGLHRQLNGFRSAASDDSKSWLGAYVSCKESVGSTYVTSWSQLMQTPSSPFSTWITKS